MIKDNVHLKIKPYGGNLRFVQPNQWKWKFLKQRMIDLFNITFGNSVIWNTISLQQPTQDLSPQSLFANEW